LSAAAAAAESLEPVSDIQVNAYVTDIGEIVLECPNVDRENDSCDPMHMDVIVRMLKTMTCETR